MKISWWNRAVLSAEIGRYAIVEPVSFDASAAGEYEVSTFEITDHKNERQQHKPISKNNFAFIAPTQPAKNKMFYPATRLLNQRFNFQFVFVANQFG